MLCAKLSVLCYCTHRAYWNSFFFTGLATYHYRYYHSHHYYYHHLFVIIFVMIIQKVP